MKPGQLTLPEINAPGPVAIKVYATPCGGTQYVHRVLRAMGYAVGHERPEKDGIVCGFHALGLRPALRGGRTDRVEPAPFDARPATVAVQLVRHPLAVAETLWRYVDRQRALRELFASVGVEDAGKNVRTALRWWVRTHERLLEGVPMCSGMGEEPELRKPLPLVLDTEDELSHWLAIESLLAFAVRRPAVPALEACARIHGIAKRETKAARVGSKPWRKDRLTWDEWHELDPDFAEKGHTLVRTFGLERNE